MAYSDKSWAAAFRIAEGNLKKSGKEIKKAAKKAWGNDLMVGAIGYQFTQGFIQGHNDTMQALKAQAEAQAQEEAEAEKAAQAQAKQEAAPEEAEAASPSEEDDSEE